MLKLAALLVGAHLARAETEAQLKERLLDNYGVSTSTRPTLAAARRASPDGVAVRSAARRGGGGREGRNKIAAAVKSARTRAPRVWVTVGVRA